MQPHFLFNTLNSIAALVHDDPAGAERMTGQLASLLRSSLDSTATPLVPLEQELRNCRAPISTSSASASAIACATTFISATAPRAGRAAHGAADARREQRQVRRLARAAKADRFVVTATARRRPRPRHASKTTARVSTRRSARKATASRCSTRGWRCCSAIARRCCDRERAGVETAVTLDVPVAHLPNVTPLTDCSPAMMRAYIVDDERLAVERLTRLLNATGRVTIAGTTTDPEAALALPARDAGRRAVPRHPDAGPHRLRAARTARARRRRGLHDGVRSLRPRRVRRQLARLPAEADRARAARSRARQSRAVRRHSRSPTCGRWRGSSRRSSRRTGGSSVSRRASASGRRCSTSRAISHFTSKDKLTFAVRQRPRARDRSHADRARGALDPRRFARIHRATIVNIGFVQELFPAVDGGVLVRLKDEQKTELSVARDRVRELKERLGI